MNEKIQSQLVFYQTEDGSSRIECHFAGDTFKTIVHELYETFETKRRKAEMLEEIAKKGDKEK